MRIHKQNQSHPAAAVAAATADPNITPKKNKIHIFENNVFRGKRGGLFVDVGAHDGVSLNNTLFFEKSRDWKGICIEPLPEVYEKLVANRPNCINLNVAVDVKEGQTEFLCNRGYTEMLSGIKDYYNPRHIQRLQNENKIYGGTTNSIILQTMRLSTIFEKYGITHGPV